MSSSASKSKRKLNDGENPQPTITVNKTPSSRMPFGQVIPNKSKSSSSSNDTMATLKKGSERSAKDQPEVCKVRVEGPDTTLAALRGSKRSTASTNDDNNLAKQQPTSAIIPAPGGLCRVYFDKASDFFGYDRPEAAGWYPATILKVTRSKNNQKRFQIASRYNDLYSDATFLYPSHDVELIQCGCNDDNKHLMYTEKGEIFYNKRPKSLNVGDLVFAYYQNGRENKCWFRGRVAWVGRNNAREPVCDIAYDDGEYECNIPYAKGTVLLVEDGKEHPAWLHGLTVELSPKKNKKIKSGIVVGIEKGSVEIEYKDGKGGSFREYCLYRSVVTSLFNTKKSESGLTISHWPNVNYELLEPDTSPLPVNMELPNEDEEPKKKKARETKDKPAPKGKTERKSKVPQNTAKKGPAKKAKSRSQAPAATKMQSLHEDDVEVIEESDYYSDDAAEAEELRPAREMLPSLATTLEKTLNSSDTQLGSDLLTFMKQHFDQVPNSQTCRELIDLITFGPRSGAVSFPDVHRLDLAQKYVFLLLSSKEMKDKLSIAAGDSYWENCLGQMTEKYYMADGDETRKTGAAIGRIAKSLHAKACCGELFLTLFEHQLKDYIHTKAADTAFTRPIVKDIISHRRGTKEGIEKCVKAYASVLIQYGHFERSDLAMTSSSSSMSLSFLRAQLRRLLNIMARLTSYLAWLYGVDAHEDTAALGRLVAHIFLKEMQENEVDPSEFLRDDSSLDDHWKSVKMRFILGLDKSIVPQLRPKLAGMLGVASEFNSIFGS